MKRPNLNTATAQEVFTYVKTHLLKQNAKSLSHDDVNGNAKCQYLNHESLMCAAGCLIPPDKYNPKIEGKLWTDVVSNGDFDISSNHMNLISDLQSVHDRENVKLWPIRLKNIAGSYGLKY